MISIIIPVYNLENYIERTLDSVFAQTYRDIEVVAVDDGSKDNSPAILDAYAKKEPRLKVIHKPNGGVTMARLDGVKVASGDYIGFVDGDDLIDPDMYQRLYDNMMKYDADISHCGYRVIKTTGTEYKYNTGRVVRQDNQAGLIDLLEGSFVEPGLCNKLYNKTLLHSLFHDSPMDFTLKNNEDLLMNYCLFKNANTSVYEDFCPYQYMIRDGSAAHGRINEVKLRDPVKASGIILQDTKNNKSIYKVAAGLYLAKITPVINNRDREFAGVRKDTIKQLRDFIPEYLHTEKSGKRKFLAVWAAYLPNTYSAVHRLYAKRKG